MHQNNFAEPKDAFIDFFCQNIPMGTLHYKWHKLSHKSTWYNNQHAWKIVNVYQHFSLYLPVCFWMVCCINRFFLQAILLDFNRILYVLEKALKSLKKSIETYLQGQLLWRIAPLFFVSCIPCGCVVRIYSLVFVYSKST